MATHYVSSSIEANTLYKNSSLTAESIETLSQNSEVTVLEEYVGLNCNFHYVSSSTNVGFVLNKHIYPLSGTADSAPYVCSIPTPNNAYVEPEWYLMDVGVPFINDRTNEYCVSVVSDTFSVTENESVIIKNGIKLLFEYYNKPDDDETIQKYLSYFIFAKIKDYYVPFRPFMRTKYLVSIHRKYFDAIDDNQQKKEIFSSEDSSKIDFVLEINLKEINDKFKSLESILNLYNTDVFFSDTTLVFSTNEEQEFVNNSIFLEMSFKEKSTNINKFKQNLDNLLILNNIPINQINTSTNEYYVQFAINSECNIIYDVSVKENKNCISLRRGINSFLNSESVKDTTTVNFVKNIHKITKINKCKVPWYEFAEDYVYPPIIVLQPSAIQQQESFELFKDLYNKFLISQNQSSREPAKTSLQLYEEQANILNYQLTSYFSSTISPFIRKVYQGDNALDPNNLQKTLANLELAILESPINTKKDIYVIKDKDGLYFNVVKNNDTPPQWAKDVEYSLDTSIFKIDTETPSVIIEGDNYVLLKANKADVAKKNAANNINAIRQQLQKIYNFINKIGICSLADLLQGCLLSLVRTLFDGQKLQEILDSTIVLGATKSFKLETILNEVIPFLPIEQQQFVYEQILLELGCVNKKSMLYTLKNYLTSDEYTTLNLDSATYEEVVSEVAKRMSTNLVSA